MTPSISGNSLLYHASLAAMCLLLTLATGCGRNDVARGCTSDGDCASDRVCYEGACMNGEDVPDMGEGDGIDDPDGGDPDQDGPVRECESNEDCGPAPAPGECFTSVSMCVESADGGSTCQSFSDDEPACPPWERLENGGTCDCVPINCSSSDDCDGYSCVAGFCSPCTRDRDCSEGVCTEQGTCEPEVCRSDEDCAANEVCSGELCEPRPECVIDGDCDDQELCLGGRCTYSPECQADQDCRDGYECIGERCFERLCRGPQDCEEGQICDAGECIEQPATVDRCFVATPSATVSPGQTITLDAFAVDSFGNGVPSNFVWTSDAPDVVSVERGRIATAKSMDGIATLTATLAGGDPRRCEGEVVLTNIGLPQPNGLRVVVVDGASGAPVSNAEVIVNGGMPVTTSANGVANLPDPGMGFEVSVFTDDYNYVTIQGVDSTDIRIPLATRSGSGPVAGFTGQFDDSLLNTQGEFLIGIGGASIKGGLINLDLPALLGDPFVINVPIPGQATEIPLPGGLVLYGRVFGLNVNLKRNYRINTPGGAKLAWGLAGRVPPSELISIFQGAGGGNLGEILALILPLFSRFDHTTKPVNLQALPRIVDMADLDRDGDTTELLPDYGSFPTVGMTPSVPQQLVTSIDVSNFPQLRNGPGEVALITGGTLLDSAGFTPLGISATSDRDGDGRPDVRLLTMAPPSGSAVNGRFSVISIAFRTDGLDIGQSGGLALPDEFSAALWNGQTLPTAISLGKYPGQTAGSVDGMSRQVVIQNAEAGPIYRARFVGTDRSWDVWSIGPAGVMGQFQHTFTVPSAPANRQDLVPQGKVLVDAIRTQVRIDDLLRPAGVILTDIALVATGFNRTKLRD